MFSHTCPHRSKMNKTNKNRRIIYYTYSLSKNGSKYKPYRDQWEYNISAAGQKNIRKFLEKGGGIFGLHTAAICFDQWEDWISILGGKWIWGKSGHLPLRKKNHKF